MEALPKLRFLSFQLKTSPEKTHFGPKLKQYISEAYRESPENYNNEIYQLESLRASAIRPTCDKSGLDVLYKYFAQLKAIQSRFPMGEGEAASVTFAWKDMYGNMTCSLSDIRFEMGCILYNIGALHSQLGAAEPRTTSDSLKAACMHFQHAAWAFSTVREQYSQPRGVDISPEMMRLLTDIFMAQAQECIMEKSIQDSRKSSVIGSIVAQVWLYWRTAAVSLGSSSNMSDVIEIIDKKQYNLLSRYIQFRIHLARCILCLYQGLNSEEQQKMGERVAYYQNSAEALGQSRKYSKYIEPQQVTTEALTFLNDVVEGKKKAAKNENEFIYHEEVPAKDTLIEMKPVPLVKALPIDFKNPEISGPDIFARLVPMAAHETLSLYSEEKAQILREVGGKIDEKTFELTEFMSSLQLDQLDVLDSDQQMPQEVLDRCAAMNANSEIIQNLVDSMNSLAEIISDVESSLAEIKGIIEEETKLEAEYQKVIGQRPPSIVQTELLREYNKYQEAHTRTTESNQVLHKAMTLHIANLRLLALLPNELEAKIPTVASIEGLDRETMTEMRRVVYKAREMKTQRDDLLYQLREEMKNDDITAKLMVSSEPASMLFEKELQKYKPKIKIIEQNLAAQENILNRLTSLYASYGDSRRQLSDVIRKREGLINALVTSYDAREELLNKSQKGFEFYSRLSHNVSALLTRLRSTCQVQREERAQMLGSTKPKPQKVTKSKEHISAATPTPTDSSPKLKDYLPYLKNRGLATNVNVPGPAEIAQDTAFYPESIYPSSIRPTPVGSEATADIASQEYADTYASQNQPSFPYNQYLQPYSQTYIYAQPQSLDNPEKTNQPYTQYYPPNVIDPQLTDKQTNQTYASYYARQNVVDPQTIEKPNQYTPYFNQNEPSVNDKQPNQYQPYYVPDNTEASSDKANCTPYYNQTIDQADKLNPMYPYYPQSVETTSEPPSQYVPSYQPNNAQNPTPYPNQQYQEQNPETPFSQLHISHSKSETNTTVDPRQNLAEYYNVNNPQISSPNIARPFPYTSTTQYCEVSTYNPMQYMSSSYNTSYSSATSVTYSVPSDLNYCPYPTPAESDADKLSNTATLSELDAMDKPIKSHVTGEALYYQERIQDYAVQNLTYPEFTNHFETSSNCDFNPAVPQNSESLVYSSAGIYDTVQSPSGQQSAFSTSNSELYYNVPYGYQTCSQANTPNELVQDGAYMSMADSTYMFSAQSDNTSVTYSNQSNPMIASEGLPNEQHPTVDSPQPSHEQTNTEQPKFDPPPRLEPVLEAKQEESEPSTIDLLADIDFSIDQKPITPQITVPPISESAIKKPVIVPEPVKPKVEEVEIPAKRDIYADPSLLNEFTQDVKNLHTYVDSLSSKRGGANVLDLRWKKLTDLHTQNKNNLARSKSMTLSFVGSGADAHDECTLTLQGNPDAHMNATHYKRLAPWCVPIVISEIPTDKEYTLFWKLVFENKIACIVCLLSEIEMQGKAYWPTGKGTILELDSIRVTLDDVICSIHWTKRTFSIASGTTVFQVTHYQITVFPTKIVCAPLLQLADRVLETTYSGRGGRELGAAWLQGGGGAGKGRAGVFASLLAVMCQVRAGHLRLQEILDNAIETMCKHRPDVMEDTKHLGDAYRTALFYAQGVLCSGTTLFNGDAISIHHTLRKAVPPTTPAPSLASSVSPSAESIDDAHKKQNLPRETFEEMKQSGLKNCDMKDPLNFLDPLWNLKKK